ncbi:MAG: universal stress protein [Pirellulales bacterium]|nr:universal stress protein [Pirellulales bacterium]
MKWFENRDIVVPVDFSDESFSAVDVALQLAEEPARVHVIHVLPLLEPLSPGMVWDTVDEDSRSQHASKALAEHLADTKYDGIHTMVAFGDAGHEVADFAEKVKAGLIVLPSHGRTGLQRLLIGSVAERVVRLAHCPVLVLRN